MLENTHRTIAEKIGSELKLLDKHKKLLIVGSVNPDSWADFPHHAGKEEEILAKIFNARILFLQNDDECFAEIGNALHYLADRWTLRPRTAEKHTKWERSIDKSPLLDDDDFLKVIDELSIPQKAINAYKKLAETLVRIKNEGLESWFDPSWGIWHEKYDWLIERYVSVVDNAMRTKLESLPSFSNLLSWQIAHVQAVYIEKDFPSTHDGAFDVLVDRSFLTPLVTGYQAGIWNLALLTRPSSWSTSILDLNFAYRICLEVTRYTVISPEAIKEDDDWNVMRIADDRGEHLKGVKTIPDDVNIPMRPSSRAPFNHNWTVIRKAAQLVSEERNTQLQQIKDEKLRIENAASFQTTTYSDTWKLLLQKVIALERKKIDEKIRLEKACVFCDRLSTNICEECGKKICEQHVTKCSVCGRTICPECTISKGLFKKTSYCLTHARQR